MIEALMSPLGKQHNRWPTSDACPQTPTHAKQTGGVNGPCAIAKLWSHWDYRDLMGQLARLECCNQWKEGLGRQGGVFAQEWLVCMKLSLEQAMRRQSLLMSKWSAPTNTAKVMLSICYWLPDQEEKVDGSLFRQLKEALQLQALVLTGGLNNSAWRGNTAVWSNQEFSGKHWAEPEKQEMKVQSYKKRTTLKRSTVSSLQH